MYTYKENSFTIWTNITDKHEDLKKKKKAYRPPVLKGGATSCMHIHVKAGTGRAERGSGVTDGCCHTCKPVYPSAGCLAV